MAGGGPGGGSANSNQGGAAGGTIDPTTGAPRPGGNGSPDFIFAGGGGGGSAGGGAGGSGGGDQIGGSGGGGGTGGTNGLAVIDITTTPSNATSAAGTGGTGGGTGYARKDGGGGGGEGGYGLILTGSGATFTNSGNLTGGNGGNGGGGGFSGLGGSGGIALDVLGSNVRLENSGALTGGNGGFTYGSGGAGVQAGSGLTLVTTGAITAGLDAGDGATSLGNAIVFTGGSNTLAIGIDQSTGMQAAITGNIASAGMLTFNQSVGGFTNDVTLASAITGAGQIIKVGTGTLTLTGANTYTGATTISGGTLALSGSGSIAQSSGVGVEGTFDISAATNDTAIKALTGGGDVVLGTHTLSVTGANPGALFSGTITGAGGLTVSGGIESLTGANTYTGTTTIGSGATLQLGNGGTAGTINAASAIVDNGTLTIAHSDTLTLANTISGTGDLLQAGTGTTILAGANTFQRAMVIANGTLQLGDGGTTGTVTSGFQFAGTGSSKLVVDHSDTVTLDHSIQGIGTLEQIGTGTLALTAQNIAFTGDIGLNAGTLELGAVNAAGTTLITFAAGAQTLKLDAVGTYTNKIAGFALDDTIDLRGLAASGATATYNATTHDLTITSGANTDVLHFDTGYSLPNGYQFAVADDGHGGTALTLGLIPASAGGGTTSTQPSQPSQPTGPVPQTANAPDFGMTVTSPASTAGGVYALYEAVLGRAPDALGLENFTTAIQNGATLADVANALIGSIERSGPNPLSDPSGFVQGLYQNLLGRAADASGLATFTGELKARVSAGTVAVQLATSAEAQAHLAPTFQSGVFVPDALEAGVARLYYGLLGRAPDAGGLKALSAFVENGGGGAVGEAARLGQAAASIISSPEFAASHPGGGDTAFVTSLYQGALGRSPDAGGQALYLDQLAHGVSRATVALEIAQSPEAQVHLVGVIEQGFQLAG